MLCEEMPAYAHAFQPLLQPLDEYIIRILEQFLSPMIPINVAQHQTYFNLYLEDFS
jgi:type III restriction enzyme